MRKIGLGLAVLILALLVPHPPSSALDRGMERIATPAGEIVTEYGESHALLIGLSNYRYQSWAHLGGVPRDIRLVSDALKRHGFKVESAADLNRGQILQRIDSFIEAHASGASGRNNRLVVYIAGHGHLVEKEYGGKLGYLVPVDAPAPGDDSFESRSVSVDEINIRAQRMDNLHTLFILDSCFSGSIISGQYRASLPPLVEVKMGRPVRYFITAGEDESTVPDNGLFARILVEGLDGEADAGARDGFVTGSELGNYVQERVTTLSKGTQRPQFGPLVNERLSKGDIIFAMLQAAGPSIKTRRDDWDNSNLEEIVVSGTGSRYRNVAGLELSSLDDRWRKLLSLPSDAEGVVVLDVDEEEKEAFRPGDLIISVNESEVETPFDVEDLLISAHKSRKNTAIVRIKRHGATLIRTLPAIID